MAMKPVSFRFAKTVLSITVKKLTVLERFVIVLSLQSQVDELDLPLFRL